MDYKVRRIYTLMLAREKYEGAEIEAKEVLESLIYFKNRYPNRKCLYWIK